MRFPVKKGMSPGVIVVIVIACLLVIGLVVVAIATIGVAAVARPRLASAQRSHAQVDARTLHPAAEKYRADHPTDPCPTVEILREKGEVSRSSKLTDPWDTPYQIVCKGDDDVVVVSWGPDKKEGTADDIRVPASP